MRKINIELSSKEYNAKLNLVRGDLTEYLAKKYYKKMGYNVVKIVFEHGEFLGSELNIKEIRMYLRFFENEDLENYLFRKDENDKHIIKGLPDFICFKTEQKEILFVECKSELNKLKEYQKEIINELQNKGYKVEIFCSKIDIDKFSYSIPEVYDEIE